MNLCKYRIYNAQGILGAAIIEAVHSYQLWHKIFTTADLVPSDAIDRLGHSDASVKQQKAQHSNAKIINRGSISYGDLIQVPRWLNCIKRSPRNWSIVSFFSVA
jgi:hypothetical protein